MKAIVVYESVFGNTHAIAAAVAEGLGGVPVLSVREAVERAGGLDLLVVGGPTHEHGLATDRSRHVAVDHAHEGAHVESDATEDPGLRSWLGDLRSTTGRPAAAFDTRADGVPLVTGSAARGIARRLRHHGFDVLATESFVVKGTEGPLKPGELERARAWGEKLAHSMSGSKRDTRHARLIRAPREVRRFGSDETLSLPEEKRA